MKKIVSLCLTVYVSLNPVDVKQIGRKLLGFDFF